MVIELFGLPGAGKTTLAHALSQELNLPLVHLSLWSRLLFWKHFFLTNPKKAFAGVQFFFRHVLTGKSRLFLYGCVDRYARFQKAMKDSGIVDEGPLQNLLSFPSRVLFQKEADDIVAMLPHPDVLIHVSAPKDIRLSRQKDRGRMARNEVWEVYAKENEALALAALPPKVLVLESPTLSIQDIVSRIRSL
jgi:deoxyadenosine/deoxycytidine kinase